MMKKRFVILLAVVMLAVVSSAGAEYKNYQVTEGNWWKCFPLDAHNTVVVSLLWQDDSEPDPWYVCWYRDGGLYREMTGSIPEGDRAARMRIPFPALWDGQHLSMYYCILKGELKTYQQSTWIATPDPNCFDVCLAEWTEEGLVNERLLREAWFDTYDHDDRGILVYSGDEGRTALYYGQKAILPDSIPVNLQENIFRIFPVDEEVCLVKVMDNANFCSQMVCIDHGTERYRVTLPQDEILPGRILLPDKQGGFFFMDGYLQAGYGPEYLLHYRGDGQYDRTLTLVGDNVVVHACASATDPGTGLCTLYGYAVANSRKVYTVFAMEIDENLNVSRLDVRKIDPAYGDYGPCILTASDGTAYVFVESYADRRLYPVLIPFDKLEKSKKTYGIKLLQ